MAIRGIDVGRTLGGGSVKRKVKRKKKTSPPAGLGQKLLSLRKKRFGTVYENWGGAENRGNIP